MTKHLKVPKKDAQRYISRMRSADGIDNNYQIQKGDDFVLIPLKQDITGQEKMPGSEVVDVEGLQSKIKFLPKEAGGAFDLIGEIAITKIREEERAIELARSLILTHPNIKAVYLDRGITGKYRLRDLKLLSGSEIYLTKYRENGIMFQIDVSKVYFSPRLATERMLVAKEVMDGETVIDLFAGVGPFALNIAKERDANIIAIDSNPYAIELLHKNVANNNLRGKITSYCADSAEKIVEFSGVDRIIMNLPHEAFSFVTAAKKTLKTGGIINYYEILNVQELEGRMETFRDMGFELRAKRVVHGYSKTQNMYSLALRKLRE